MAKQALFPEGEDLEKQIASRHFRGNIWRTLFILSTVIAIVVLLSLLYNIFSSAFGLAAVQTTISPESLVLAFEEERMLNAPNVTSSEDDNELAAGITADPNAVGFFGYAYYRENADRLKLLTVDGVTPSAESAASGEYPYSRPLYIYTTAEILEENPQVATFVDYYLNNVTTVIDEVGYFPATNEAMASGQEAVDGAIGGNAPSINSVEGTINIAGSSTVFPLTQRLADDFIAEGFGGEVAVESIGSTAGLRAFCVDGTAQIANASRPINQAEREACRANDREPIEILVGTDALAIVANPENSFASDISRADLGRLFTSGQTWADINASWPAEPIGRYIPGADSGTLDFFSTTTFAEVQLENLPKEVLVNILIDGVSAGLGRRLEREQRFYDDLLIYETEASWAEVCGSEEPPEGCTLPARSQQNVYDLVFARVVEPDVVQTWDFVPSLLNREEILAEAAIAHPDAEVEFRSWLTTDFIVSPQSSEPELAGVRTAIFGSIWVISITILFSFPIGVGAAIYLEEYASHENWINRIIQTNIANLAGVPSIIYGMLGLAIFVRLLESITSGAVFGVVEADTTANGRTIVSAGLTLGLLILPIIIINAQEAIRAVPLSLRQASMGLGATKWQTIWNHVLPAAIPGILTGTILAMARAVGETAPVVVIGASTFITVDPTGPFSKFTVLPIQIYQWTARPQDEFRNIAAAAIIVLLALMLTLNASAVLLRNRFSR